MNGPYDLSRLVHCLYHISHYWLRTSSGLNPTRRTVLLGTILGTVWSLWGGVGRVSVVGSLESLRVGGSYGVVWGESLLWFVRWMVGGVIGFRLRIKKKENCGESNEREEGTTLG